MPKPSGYASSRAASWQDWMRPMLLVALFIGSLFLLLLGRSESVTGAQQSAIAGASQIGHVISNPIEMTTNALANFQHSLANMKNAGQLATDNAVLLQWKQRAEQLQAENESLRQLLKVVPVMHPKELTARVLGSAAGPYRHHLTLAAGSEDGVSDQMAVVDTAGLVGRIISVQSRTSQVLNLTDINSRIAVITGKGREHAVVKGLGDGQLGLFYLPEDAQVSVGEKLYTSGDAELMPTDILVGTVSKVSETEVTVVPAVDRARLGYVRLLVAK